VPDRRENLEGGDGETAWATLCASPHNTVPDQYYASPSKHGELAQVYRLTPPISLCAPPTFLGGLPLVPVSLPYLISPPLSFRCLQFFFGAGIFPSLSPGSLAVQYLLPCPFLQILLPLVTTLLGPFLVRSSVTIVVLLG
jgi:hypothetical protein